MIFYSSPANSRIFWLLLVLSAVIPVCLALAFQHFLGIPPCVLCIYQRIALLGIALAALLVLCAPTCRFLQGIGTSFWLYSAVRGLMVAWEQTQRYLYPARFVACEFRVRLPSWAPLDEWLPSVFRAYSACDKVEWSFLSLSLPQWMVVLFAAHLLLSFSLLVGQGVAWRQRVKHQPS